MAVLVKKSFFQNFSTNFDFFQKSFAAQFSTNLAQFSTAFVVSKKQNCGAGKKSFIQNFSPNFHFFQKSFAAQFSTTFVFLKKQNGGANFLDIYDFLIFRNLNLTDFFLSECVLNELMLSSWILN